MNPHSVSQVRNDHISGAARLTSGSLGVLLSFVKIDESRTPGTLCNKFAGLCEELIRAQPFMASIRNRVSAAIDKSKKLAEEFTQVQEVQKRLINWLQAENRRHKNALHHMGNIGSEIIDANVRVLTYSGSGSVLQVFKAVVKNEVPFSVVLSEARPMNEGIHFAGQLAKLKIETILVIDIHLLHYIPSAQRVIIGADWISETQYTNKVGSALLVERAIKQNIPVYVAATTDKILAQKYYPLTVDEQPPDEILRTQSGHITIKNRYFEAVPIMEEVKFITERGILTHEEIIKIAERTTFSA